MFDDDFTGCDHIEPCLSSGPVVRDKRVRVVAQSCPVTVAFLSATVRHFNTQPDHTGPPRAPHANHTQRRSETFARRCFFV